MQHPNHATVTSLVIQYRSRLYPKGKLRFHLHRFSTRLHRREVAWPRVPIELHALNVDIAIMSRAPELKQDIPSRTTVLSAQFSRPADIDLHGWMELDRDLALVLRNEESSMRR